MVPALEAASQIMKIRVIATTATYSHPRFPVSQLAVPPTILSKLSAPAAAQIATATVTTRVMMMTGQLGWSSFFIFAAAGAGLPSKVRMREAPVCLAEDSLPAAVRADSVIHDALEKSLGRRERALDPAASVVESQLFRRSL